jgi:anhydro-N-acetylmuramic acid kinase
MDRGGALASRGRVDAVALAALLDNPWFALPFPKSLDRDAFSLTPVADLSTEDGLATLAAFTAETVAGAIRRAGDADRIVVSGGGANNPFLLRVLAERARQPIERADDLGWAGDFIEAEAFAYLAARSVNDLPLTFPATTGVPAPQTGGVIARP